MISSIDTSSPFFASLAGQSDVQNERLKSERTQQKKLSEQKKSFKSVMNDTISESAGVLSRISGMKKEDAVQVLMADIETAGDALAQKPVLDNLRTYKQAVQSFIHFIVENSYTVETTETGSSRKKKVHTLVHVVDKELEHLAADILSNQQTRLKILERLGEIRGMLIDIAT